MDWLTPKNETTKPRGHRDRSKSVRGARSVTVWRVRPGTAGDTHYRAPRGARLVSPMAFGSAWLLGFCLLVGWGCSADKRQVEDVAFQFVEGIAQQDPQILDTAVDWERYFSVEPDEGAPGTKNRRSRRRGNEGDALEPSSPARGTPDWVEQQKNTLLGLLMSDRSLAISYLTADHSIEKTTIDGNEARVEISQKDRATGEENRLTLQLYKHPEKGWKIYKFRSEEVD